MRFQLLQVSMWMFRHNASVIGILVLQITHKRMACAVPAFKMLSGQSHNSRRGQRVPPHRLDVLSCDVSHRLVVHPIHSQSGEFHHTERGHRRQSHGNLQHVIEGLLPPPGQAINAHILDPLFARVTAGVPAGDDALIGIPAMPEQRAHLEAHASRAGGARDGRAPQDIDLVHALDELEQALALRLAVEQRDDVLLQQGDVPRGVRLEVLEQVGQVLAAAGGELRGGEGAVVAGAEDQHGPDGGVEGAVHVRVGVEPGGADAVQACLCLADGLYRVHDVARGAEYHLARCGGGEEGRVVGGRDAHVTEDAQQVALSDLVAGAKGVEVHKIQVLIAATGFVDAIQGVLLWGVDQAIDVEEEAAGPCIEPNPLCERAEEGNGYQRQRLMRGRLQNEPNERVAQGAVRRVRDALEALLTHVQGQRRRLCSGAADIKVGMRAQQATREPVEVLGHDVEVDVLAAAREHVVGAQRAVYRHWPPVVHVFPHAYGRLAIDALQRGVGVVSPCQHVFGIIRAPALLQQRLFRIASKLGNLVDAPYPLVLRRHNVVQQSLRLGVNAPPSHVQRAPVDVAQRPRILGSNVVVRRPYRVAGAAQVAPNNRRVGGERFDQAIRLREGKDGGRVERKEYSFEELCGQVCEGGAHGRFVIVVSYGFQFVANSHRGGDKT
ncbi:hypothetical protein B5807_02970 [Epicoccum nigrum]|uniref:Uncharacterized protein n=1 Tax=Epicoccum nigrum TaxID=105696 RepID=A0A1Y2MBN6_EPING|nr:hypothetical protein B5807_02970 [Epicoccum nigrum]